MGTISHRKKKYGNWLRIESGTNIELVLAKNKTDTNSGHKITPAQVTWQLRQSGIPGPDTYWFRNNIYMHRLFFGSCNLPDFNFNIPVIICHKIVQRNVKTIKDISKHEKI